jgi:hypothetical protein
MFGGIPFENFGSFGGGGFPGGTGMGGGGGAPPDTTKLYESLEVSILLKGCFLYRFLLVLLA